MSSLDLVALVQEVDPNGHLSTSTDGISSFANATAIPGNDAAYQYIDYGATYFSKTRGFCVAGTAKISSASGPTWQDFVSAVSNDLHTVASMQDAVCMDWYPYQGAAASFSILTINNGVVVASDADFSYPINQEYSYVWGYSSSLSQHGAVYYIDSLGNFKTKVLDYNPTWRYFLPIVNQGGNTPTDLLTAYQTQMDLTIDENGLDLTTFTETDTGSKMSLFTNCAEIVNTELTRELTLYKDYGANYFNTNFLASCSIWVKTLQTLQQYPCLGVLVFRNSILGSMSDNAIKIGVEILYVSNELFRLRIKETYAGVTYTTTAAFNCFLMQPITIELARTSAGQFGSLVLTAFLDTAKQGPVGAPIVHSLHTSASWQYFFAVMHGGVGSSSAENTITIGKVELNTDNMLAATASLIESSDTIAASAAVAQNITSQITFTEKPDIVSAVAFSPLTASLGFVESNDQVLIRSRGASLEKFEPFTLTVRDKNTNQKIVGLTNVTISVMKDANAFSLDFADNDFRQSAVFPTLILAELDRTNQPGLYGAELITTNFEGEHTFTFEYDDGETINVWTISSVNYKDGQRIANALTDPFENSYSLRDFLRLASSFSFANGTVPNSANAFDLKSLDGQKSRLVGTVNNNTRTFTTIDPT